MVWLASHLPRLHLPLLEGRTYKITHAKRSDINFIIKFSPHPFTPSVLERQSYLTTADAGIDLSAYHLLTSPWRGFTEGTRATSHILCAVFTYIGGFAHVVVIGDKIPK